MTKRYFDVEVSASVRVEIDDEAVSEPDERDGRRWKILETFADDRRFDPGSTQDTVVGNLAVVVGVDRRRVGRTDGWADFPEDSVKGYGWPDWTIGNVTEVRPT